jgi:NarL family two-component system sensor histidine kinase YdfH
MQPNPSPEFKEVGRDPRLLFGIVVTLVVVIIYLVTLINMLPVQQPLILLVFTGLSIAHILLHWQVGKITNHPGKTTLFLIIQGLLAFVISLFAENLGMTLSLFMLLVGEAIGLFGLKRRGFLLAVYFSVLLTVNLINLYGLDSLGMILLSTIPSLGFVILFVSLYMRQIEARQQALSLTAEIESANRQLAEYAAQVEELTLTAERQRIARELHDILSQGLTGLVLQLEAIKAHLEAGRGDRALDIIDQSLARARSTLASSRAAIDDLRAVPASLPEAMRAKTDRFTQTTGIPCELYLLLGDTTPPAATGDHLLHILNEALTNITRHAQAGQVKVKVEAKNDHIELEVNDDGKGFDPGKSMEAGHYGLLGMRERARLMKGTLGIESGTGRGTQISLVVPIFLED